jgi:osmotically inducible protein OsmC
MQAIYTASARVSGGRASGGPPSPGGELVVRLRMPKELGGDGDGTNPEQLFAVGHAACFEASIALAAQRIGVDATELEGSSVQARVSLLPAADGLRLGVALDVTLPAVSDAGRAAYLVRAAHGICPYSRAVRDNVDVVLTANRALVPG